ncbi:lipopolysaccharide biosynthesis protein RfbH [Pelotomaculum propionicicum]|nr:lipopolysaccharide biosynthesis protein RfbH [Pelotomaculum propionicicum]
MSYVLEAEDLFVEKSVNIPLGIDLNCRLKIIEEDIKGKAGEINLPCLEKLWRSDISSRAEQFYNLFHTPPPFEPGKTWVSCAGKVYDEKEIISLINASLDFWLTTGRYASFFEEKLANFLGARYCLLTNSGSSANLLAISSLTSAKLGERRLRPGDEVITVAAGFPTTVAPILQNRLTPVFVDVDPETYNVAVEQLESAVSTKTRAIILAHTLGNPFNLDAITKIVKRYGLWLIEDNCDALGSTYRGRYTGTFGDLATLSFYPAHHITMGEGGAVLTSDPLLKRITESFRDWGRDCWCPPGKDNTCRRRFAWRLGELPSGYDHKYTYSHLGYNLKITDMQAAVGVAQLNKLADFACMRRKNFQQLYAGLQKHKDVFILPKSTENADPCWFGFPLTVRDGAPFTRQQLIQHLEDHRIRTRLLFAGNILKQPAFQDVHYRVAGELKNTDLIMERTFWIGLYPGLGQKEIDYVLDAFDWFMRMKLARCSNNNR